MAELIRGFEVKHNLDACAMTEDEILNQLKPMVEPVLEYLKHATDPEIEEKFARKFGEGGVVEYHYALCEIIHSKNPDFGSEDFKNYLIRKTDERVHEANQDIIDLNREMTDYIVQVLKRVYGTHESRSGEKVYWELGIESTTAKEYAYKQQQADPVEKRAPKEAYLKVLDLMKIVRQKANWPHFKDVFNIQMPGEKGKAYYLGWMEKFNTLRRIPSHSSPWRMYSEEDFVFLEWIKPEFYSRLAAAKSNETA